MSYKDLPERQTTLRVLPTRQPDPAVLRRACKRPRCGNEIDRPAGRSRPREFCSDECRNLYQRERDQARNVLFEARRLALQYEIDETAAAESSLHGTGSPERVPNSTGPSPSHLALSLVAQALESIRVDLQDGVPLDLEGVLARMARAKEEGDRLLRRYGQSDRL
jgi:predicted nucleic acid-binding Zn ribbon protein